jgi:hypothetical protein
MASKPSSCAGDADGSTKSQSAPLEVADVESLVRVTFKYIDLGPVASEQVE